MHISFHTYCTQMYLCMLFSYMQDALALKAIAKTAADQLQANWPLHFATGDKKVEAGLTNRVGTLFAVVKNCIVSLA